MISIRLSFLRYTHFIFGHRRYDTTIVIYWLIGCSQARILTTVCSVSLTLSLSHAQKLLWLTSLKLWPYLTNRIPFIIQQFWPFIRYFFSFSPCFSYVFSLSASSLFNWSSYFVFVASWWLLLSHLKHSFNFCQLAAKYTYLSQPSTIDNRSIFLHCRHSRTHTEIVSFSFPQPCELSNICNILIQVI